MRRSVTTSRPARRAASVVGLLVLCYLCLLALRPSAANVFPTWLRWFGQPGSGPTIAVTLAVLAFCLMAFRSAGAGRTVGISFTVIAALISVTAVLGLSSYWYCHDINNPAIFTPLMATASLVKEAPVTSRWAGTFAPARPRSPWRWPG